VLSSAWAALGDTGFSWTIGHQGLAHDKESGLVFNRARYLHPYLGRFVQRDLLNYINGGNLYETEGSSPAASVDPSGTYYWKLFTWGLAAGRGCIAGYELTKCLECISDKDKLLTNAAAKMPAAQYYSYRMMILNSHTCGDICAAAAKDGMKA